MKKFRPSELFFLLSGLLLIITSIEFMRTSFSLAKFFNLRATAGDPFEAMYFYQKADAQNPQTKPPAHPEATSPLPVLTATPIPVATSAPIAPPVATATPLPVSTPKASLTPAPTPNKPTLTPSPTLAPTPLAIRTKTLLSSSAPAEVEQANIFLVSPTSQAVVTLKPTGKSPPSLKFTFEVYPAGASSHFDLLMNGKAIESREITGLPEGKYTLEIPAPASGLYQWQVKTAEKTSELRGLTVKAIH